MIPYCHNCGANLKPGAKTCRRCGAPVPQEGEGVVEQPRTRQRDKLKHPEFIKQLNKKQLLLIAAALLLALVLIIALVAVAGSGKDAPEPTPPVLTAPPEPVKTPEPSPEPTPQPDSQWVGVYRNFLETGPTVNSRLLSGAENYGFEDTVTAELFALADLNQDAVPELLLAQRTQELPGWNVSGAEGLAVKSYIVCSIVDGRVSPQMCGGTDFQHFPLLLSVNDSWLLEQRYTDNGPRMEFKALQSQGSSLNLKSEGSTEPRINSLGETYSLPMQRYYLDSQEIGETEYLGYIFPEGRETLSYYPILFKPLEPGCLDDMESSWLEREQKELSRLELNKLWNAAGYGSLQPERSEAIPYISDAYCIAVDTQDSLSHMVLGIDPALGYGYVQEIKVVSVTVSGADSWVHSSTNEGLPEGQIFEYVVGVSVAEGETIPQNYTLISTVELTLKDGSKLELNFQTQSP